jgi:hypothetical protein
MNSRRRILASVLFPDAFSRLKTGTGQGPTGRIAAVTERPRMIRGRAPVFDVGRNGIPSYKIPLPGPGGVRPKIMRLDLNDAVLFEGCHAGPSLASIDLKEELHIARMINGLEKRDA